MLTVVDCGCATIGSERSIDRLIDEYRPDVLFGCDPNVDTDVYHVGDTTVILSPLVAWTSSRTVDFVFDATRSRVVTPAKMGPVTRRIQTFDLGGLLFSFLASGDEVVLKLDVEGSEYVLLPDLHERDVDSLLSKILVEWHPQFEPAGHPPIPELRCPVEEWV
jgi:hypothetical protein